MPLDWESEFGGYPYFYAPGISLFARTELNLANKSAFRTTAEKFRQKAPTLVPRSLSDQIGPRQPDDWEKLGPNQIERLYGTKNLGFAKLVMGLIVVQLIANDKKVKVNVFERFRFHAALFHFTDFDPKFFREEIIEKHDVMDEFKSSISQKPKFIESFGGRSPATFRSINVINNWLKQKFPDKAQGAIYAHDERKKKAAEKETVAADPPPST
ncbi:MAG: hypothetical protein AAF936_11805 [Pseudomonadota bacterium]